MTKATLNITGMKCGGCEKAVQEAVDAVPGVISSKASAKEGVLEVEFDETNTGLDAIKHAVKEKGYPSV
jgi:copper chaperone